jgi:hypothetical protein
LQCCEADIIRSFVTTSEKGFTNPNEENDSTQYHRRVHVKILAYEYPLFAIQESENIKAINDKSQNNTTTLSWQK